MPAKTSKRPKHKFRRQPQPVCPIHGYPMRVGRTTPTVRYCYCPDENCKESYTQMRREEQPGEPDASASG